jgi:hypothetical protein
MRGIGDCHEQSQAVHRRVACKLMRAVVLATLSLALAACTAAVATRAQDSGSTPAPVATPTAPLPVVNVDDMMGMFPQQTVFVTSTDHVSAVTLLNHFIRYQIRTQGTAEVKTDPGARFLYVMDDDANGGVRLRLFDLPTGAERTVLGGVTDVVPGGSALGVASDGSFLVLKSNASQAWVDAYQRDTLQFSGVVMHAPTCSDRLITNTISIAIVCSSTGEVALGSLRGATASIDAVMPNVVGADMAGDGTLYLVTRDEHLAAVRPGSITAAALAWSSGWTGSVVPDSLAVVQSGTQIVLAETTADGAWLRLTTDAHIPQQQSFQLAGVPNGGVVAMWPFAYYAVGSTIRHVDLTSGLLETMAEVGAGAAAAAVVNG